MRCTVPSVPAIDDCSLPIRSRVRQTPTTPAPPHRMRLLRGVPRVQKKSGGGLPAYPLSGFRVRPRSRQPARRLICRGFSTARGFLHTIPFQRRRENPVTGLGGLPDLLRSAEIQVALIALPSLHLEKMLAARLSQHS